MRRLLFIILIGFSSIALGEKILTNNIKINLVESFSASGISDLWDNTNDYIGVRIQLNIKNITQIVINDNKPICKNPNKQLLLIVADEPMPKSFNIIIRPPCIINHKGDITLLARTSEKKYYYINFKFNAVRNSPL